MSRICLALTGTSLEENLSYIKQYRKHIDLVELRGDFLNPLEYDRIKDFPSMAGLPVILTLRKPEDGGHFRQTEEMRRNLIKTGLTGGYAFLDLEHDTLDPELEEAAAKAGTRIIRSMHDFEKVPEDIEGWMKKLSQKENEIPKMALMPRSVKDLLTLVKASKKLSAYKEKIILGMGAWGFATRILAAPLGSYLTFCSVPGGDAAPGHIDPETLDTLYNFRKISSKTEIYGIIGNPVMHTASPQIHNSGYRSLDLDAVYLPFLVDEVKDFFKLAKFLKLKGFSVTIPHKENVIPYLKETDETLRAIGACNTVYPLPGGGWGGTNTDAQGFITPLIKMFGGGLKGRKATVIGAGGAGKGVAYALKKEGCQVLILNRTKSKALDLGEKLGCSAMGLDEEGIKAMADSNIIVQTTNIGMHPDTENDPIEDYEFSGMEVAYDIIYKPLKTRFIKRATLRGCRTITGDQMLLHQGFDQFKIFTHKDYPLS